MSSGKTFALLADENLHGALYKGLRRRLPALDIVRVQDVGLSGVDDPGVLEWAAVQGRIVLTHDVRTMIGYAGERVRDGHPMPGLFVIRQDASMHEVLDDLVLIFEATDVCAWENIWEFVPLR